MDWDIWQNYQLADHFHHLPDNSWWRYRPSVIRLNIITADFLFINIFCLHFLFFWLRWVEPLLQLQLRSLTSNSNAKMTWKVPESHVSASLISLNFLILIQPCYEQDIHICRRSEIVGKLCNSGVGGLFALFIIAMQKTNHLK